MSVCAVCGAVVRPPFEAPQAELASDLDFRPGEPARSTLRQWVGFCSGCGAAAPDLAALDEGDQAVVRSDPEYAALRDQAPLFARSFLLWALLCQRRGDAWGVADALLQAAWAADDGGEAEWAAAWRLQAAAAWPDSPVVQTRLCLIDIYRRAGAFDRAAVVAEALESPPPGTVAPALDDASAAILAFQRRLIAEGETGRQLRSSALRPPAVRPNLAYAPVRKPVSGIGVFAEGLADLWRKLTGRG